MTHNSFKSRMLAGDMLAGTFVKTPAHEVVEVLALSGLDFIALDAEHAPFDRGRLDASLAIARALNFPALVRVPDGRADEILKVLDSGAVGVIVPHVNSLEKAENVARWSRFGHGGRGFAGSTRWAGYATRAMPEILQQSIDETVVIAQIEEPEGVEAASDIAAVEGIDGLFTGPADLAVSLGTSNPASTLVRDAMRHVGECASRHHKGCMTFAPSTESCAELKALGVSMFFIGSEQGFMLNSARTVAAGIHALDKS